MGDFGYLSDTDDSAVEELISQAKELSALEQIAAINCSGFTDSSALPDDLESRFRRLKSQPDPVSSKISNKKDLGHSKSVAGYSKEADLSGNQRNPGKKSGFDHDSSVNKRDLGTERSSRGGLDSDGSGDFSDSGSSKIFSPAKRTQKLLPKEKHRVGSFDLATPPSSDSEPEKKPKSKSKSKSKSSSSSWVKKLSPAKIIGYIWSSPNKSSAAKKKSLKSIKSFGGRERDVDFDEFLSDLNAYSVEDQRKMLKKALKEQQKMRKEAAEIIKMTRKASARFDFDDD